MKTKVYLMSAYLTGRGGMEMAILNMYKYLTKKKELDIEIIIFSGEENNIKSVFKDNYILADIYKLNTYKKFTSQIKAYFYMEKIVKENKNFEKTILIATDPWTLGIGNRIRNRFKNTKSILWSHFNVDIYLNSKTWLYNKFIFKNADMIYVLNSWSRNKLSTELKTTNIKVLPNGITMNKDNLIQYKKSNFIYIGRVDNYTKNLDILFNSLSKLKGEWLLTVIGNGIDLKKYKDFAKEKSLNEKIIFKGWVDEPWDHVSEAAFLVLPTINEGFGLVLIEAMNRGLPVIVNGKAEGPKDIVKENINGLFFDSTNTLEKIMQDEIDNSIGLTFNKDEIRRSIKDFDIDVVGENFYRQIKNI